MDSSRAAGLASCCAADANTPRCQCRCAPPHTNKQHTHHQPRRYPNLEAIGDLTAAEVETIWDYQRKTRARSAKWGAWIGTLGFMPAYDTCGGETQGLAFTPEAPLAGAGVPADAALTSAGLWK